MLHIKNQSVGLLGYWSAIFFTITGVLYGISMGLLISHYTIPEYTSLDEFTRLVDQRFIHLYSYSQMFAFVSTLLFVIVLSCIHDNVDSEYKIFTRLSIIFSATFMVLACVNYFTQFSMVKSSIQEGMIHGLDQFVQFNPHSFLFAMNMLAWSLFLGLSTLFLAFLFKGKGVYLATRISLSLTSLFCFIGLIGYIGNVQGLLFIFQIGMTLGLTMVGFLLVIVFKRCKTNYY